MSTNDRRLQLDLAAARYLEALERDNFSVTSKLWELAQADPELVAVLREVHAGLIEEQEAATAATVEAALTAAVEGHLPSAEIVRPADAVVTVADVAEELFRHTPERLPA